jgi:hypothetical protein
MISLRLALPAILVAAAVAGCFAYFLPPPLTQAESDHRMGSTLLDQASRFTWTSPNIDRPSSAEDQGAAAFQRAAEAILRRTPDAQASARTEEPAISGHVPLPKRRPIPRP